jgi:hypothetical protein
MSGLMHERDIGRRVLAESIELQHRVALEPLPPVELPPGHPLLRHTAVAMTVLLMVTALWVLFPPPVMS